LPFLATKSNVASTLLLVSVVWTGLNVTYQGQHVTRPACIFV